MPVIETMFELVGIAVAILVAAAFALSAWLYRRLRTLHRETWTALGEPSLLWNASMRNQQRVTRFLWRNRYRELGDPALDRVAAAAKALTVVMIVLVVIAFVLLPHLP